VKNGFAVALLFTSAVSAAYGQPEPKAVVKQSIDKYEWDWHEALAWCYRQTDTVHSDGRMDINVSDITPLGGTPFERLVMKDGQKLTPEQREKEERKYRKMAEERARETPAEREERLAKYEKERLFIREIPQAYDFTLLGEETVNGRPAWVIKLEPHPGFVPSMPHASLLRHIEGKLWIDKEDFQWAKAEANVIDPIDIGLILARIGPGTRIQVDQLRIADNFWMPREIKVEGAVKVLLVHTKKIDENLAYSEYRRDAPLVAEGVSDTIRRSSSTPQPTYPKIQPAALAQGAERQQARSNSLR
jgi:hypothetical protein